MPKYSAGLGDRVEVAQHHRLAGSKGVVVAFGDNPHSKRPDQKYHIRFDRPVWGAIHQREIWMDSLDFMVVEKASEDFVPPQDVEKPGAPGDD